MYVAAASDAAGAHGDWGNEVADILIVYIAAAAVVTQCFARLRIRKASWPRYLRPLQRWVYRNANRTARATRDRLIEMKVPKPYLPATKNVTKALTRRDLARVGAGAVWLPPFLGAAAVRLLAHAGWADVVMFGSIWLFVVDMIGIDRSRRRDQVAELAVRCVELMMPGGEHDNVEDEPDETIAHKLTQVSTNLCRAIEKLATARIPKDARLQQRDATGHAEQLIANINALVNRRAFGELAEDELSLASLLASLIQRQTASPRQISSLHLVDPELLEDVDLAPQAVRDRRSLRWVWGAHISLAVLLTAVHEAVRSFGADIEARVFLTSLASALGIYTIGQLGIPTVLDIKVPWNLASTEPRTPDAIDGSEPGRGASPR
jgi:hypothetical protein